MNQKTEEISGVVSVGAYAVDYIKRVDKIPAPGAVSRILKEQVSSGGHACNLLLNLRRLGADFKLYAAGWLGRDVDGHAVLEDCEKHHLDTRWLHLSKADHTSYNDVMVRPETGERSILARLGAHARFALKDIKIEESSARFLYLSPLLGLGELDNAHKLSGTQAAELLRMAQRAGMKTAVSLIPISGQRDKVWDALKFTDYLFLGEEDVSFLTDIPLRFQTGLNQYALEEAGRELLAKGIRTALILKLTEGALFVPKKGKTVFVPSVNLPLNRIQSLGGVDSAFNAGVVYGLYQQLPIEQALQIGFGAAASCSMDLSTSGGVRPVARCLELYKQYQRNLVF